MRDVVYFHGYGATRALIVLGIYAGLGAILAIIAGRIRAGAPAASGGEQVSATAQDPSTGNAGSA
jgi:hypothetical protein